MVLLMDGTTQSQQENRYRQQTQARSLIQRAVNGDRELEQRQMNEAQVKVRSLDKSS